MKYVAVVFVEDPLTEHGRMAAYVGDDKLEVYARAEANRHEWDQERPERGYTLLGGILNVEIRRKQPEFDFFPLTKTQTTRAINARIRKKTIAALKRPKRKRSRQWNGMQDQP